MILYNINIRDMGLLCVKEADLTKYKKCKHYPQEMSNA